MGKTRARVVRGQAQHSGLTGLDWLEIVWKIIPEAQKAGVQIEVTPLPETDQVKICMTNVEIVNGKLYWHKNKRPSIIG